MKVIQQLDPTVRVNCILLAPFSDKKKTTVDDVTVVGKIGCEGVLGGGCSFCGGAILVVQDYKANSKS